MRNRRVNAIEELVVESFVPIFGREGDVLWSIGAAPTDDPRRSRKGDNIRALPTVVVFVGRALRLFLIDSVEARGPMTVRRRDVLIRFFRLPGIRLTPITAYRTRSDFGTYGASIVAGTMCWFADEPGHLMVIDNGPLACLRCEKPRGPIIETYPTRRT